MDVLLQISLNFYILEVEATHSGSATTPNTRCETTLANHAVGAYFHSLLSCLDRLLTQLMIPLDSTHRKLAKVNVFENVASFNSLIGPFCSIFSVPFLPNLLVRRHVVRNLIVHLQCKTAQH